MTVIAGFQCLDGVLMCADSEQGFSRESDSKSQTRKIAVFGTAHANVAIGGAGDADLIEYTQHELKKKFTDNCPSWEQAETWFQSFAQEVWDSVMVPYAGLPTVLPSADFLIGLYMHGSSSLYKWERNMLHEIKTHTSIGIGIIQAEPLLGDLSFRFAAKHMLLYAVRAMLRVKQLVQGCGGKTEIVLLNDNGLQVRFATVHVDAIEYLIEEVDRFLLDDVLRFISGRVKLSETSDLDVQEGRLIEFQNRYQQILRDAMFLVGGDTPVNSTAPPSGQLH